MSDQSENLWPDDLAAEPGDKPPLVILREQAAKLGEMTKNIVEAHVSTDPWPDGRLVLRFTLLAPALGGYEYMLFRAFQPADLYPIDIEWEGGNYRPDDEKGFKVYLENIFNAARTRKVISSLIAQSRS